MTLGEGEEQEAFLFWGATQRRGRHGRDWEAATGRWSSSPSSSSSCLVLGNSVKHCHPRNVGLPIFMKQVCETAIGKRFIFMKKGWNEES
jgi:hypothetical protein